MRFERNAIWNVKKSCKNGDHNDADSHAYRMRQLIHKLLEKLLTEMIHDKLFTILSIAMNTSCVNSMNILRELNTVEHIRDWNTA